MTAGIASAPASTPTSHARLGPLKVTQARVVRSEWTKFRSLKSTMWTLLVGVVLMIGIGALFSAVNANQYSGFSASDKASFDAISTSLNGITFAQLAIGVLGVLIVSGEYNTGMIRSSLTAVPRRLPVLWGKLTVFGGVVLGVSLVASFASFLLGQSLLDGAGVGVSLSADGAFRSVIGAALYLTLAGIIGMTLGSLMRNTAAGISTFVGVFFVLPPLANLLPSSIANHVVQFFPSNAGAVLYGSSRGLTNPLSWSGGLAVLCGYAVVLVAAAAWRLQRRDA